MTLHEMGRHDAAAEVFARAARLDPKIAVAHQGLDTSLHSLSRHDEALDSYDRAEVINPAEARTQVMRAETLSVMGHNEDALGAAPDKPGSATTSPSYSPSSAATARRSRP